MRYCSLLATVTKSLFFRISPKIFIKKYFLFKIFFYLCVKIKKPHFSKFIVLAYFDTVKDWAVEKNHFLQRERGLTYKRLRREPALKGDKLRGGKL